MNKINTLLFVVVAMFGLPPSAFSMSSKPLIISEAENFIKTHDELKNRGLIDYDFNRELLNSYESLSWAKSLSSELSLLANEELSKILRTVDIVTFYTNDIQLTRQFATIAEELDRRNLLSSRDLERVVNALLAARLYDEARRIVKISHGYTVSIPNIPFSNETQRMLMVDPIDYRVTGKNFEFPKGAFVIVVGSPLCHFSNNAFNSINQDKEISMKMAGRSQWLMPQQRNENLPAVAAWNRKNVANQFSIVYKASNWPKIGSWETPTFYFFNDGLLVDTLAGWPDQGQIDLLRKKLQKAGF